MNLKIKGANPFGIDLQERDQQKMYYKKYLLENGKISKPGALRLPALLDQRRIDYCIPDSAFSAHCTFDRIWVWQIGNNEGPYSADEKDVETYPGTSIIKTERSAERDKLECPRGILISAGLKALDELYSHGYELGHIVRFIHSAPWRQPVDVFGAKTIYAMQLRSGDLTASEDLAENLRTGKVRMRFNKETRQHEFLDQDGELWSPEDVWIPEDR